MGDQGIGAPLKTSEQKHQDIGIPRKKIFMASKDGLLRLVRNLKKIELSDGCRGFNDDERRNAAIFLKRKGLLSPHIYLPRRILDLFMADLEGKAMTIPPKMKWKPCILNRTDDGTDKEITGVFKIICPKTSAYLKGWSFEEDDIRVIGIKTYRGSQRSFTFTEQTTDEVVTVNGPVLSDHIRRVAE